MILDQFFKILGSDPTRKLSLSCLAFGIHFVQISLETSTVEVTEDGPVYSPTPNLQTLYTHCVEAKRQYQVIGWILFFKQFKIM